MVAFLQKLFGGAPVADAPVASLPKARRVYAIGDVHGRLDLLKELAAAIERDDAARAPAQTSVILLGDLIDRGADSAGVVAFARDWQDRADVRVLAGNHEEMFLKSFESTDILRHFLRHGGRETLLSYGVDPQAYDRATAEEVQAMMIAAVSEAERAYIASFEDMIVLGDYVFVHAGIDPAQSLEEQGTADLRWIREPFLSHEEPFGFVVVHGHTIVADPVVRANRIGVDTGAYASGKLTALALEGGERWFIETVQDEDGAITTRIY
ncbi:serine/threonine protein phosphatase [Aurantiacibacter xanthus]|uniref:Serine/threonine protein phosphatase n=1 Tax=Aurantiacibacter xanthus TaxID=1784712 RepID=A0A3A1P679_9SPHN|nr:metallophosphoesterase family protein [Aurantiacibacter xanthus]RIV83275.1 serine/threonine protein phosphatase [Aurantiacibacter xanthus]